MLLIKTSRLVLKQSAQADLPESAVPILKPTERREVFEQLLPTLELAAEFDA